MTQHQVLSVSISNLVAFSHLANKQLSAHFQWPMNPDRRHHDDAVMLDGASGATASRGPPCFALAVCGGMCCCAQGLTHLSGHRGHEQQKPTVCRAPAGCSSCHSQSLRCSLQGLINQFGRWLSVTAVAKPMFLRKLFHSIMEPGRNEPNRGLTRQQIHDILVRC